RISLCEDRRDRQQEEVTVVDVHRTWWLLALMAGCARGVPLDVPAASSELTLEATILLSGSRSAILRPGDEVVSGDGLQVVVKPTVAAHVYVAYCDTHRQLALFPGDGGLAASAGMVTYAPARGA